MRTPQMGKYWICTNVWANGLKIRRLKHKLSQNDMEVILGDSYSS